MICNPTMKKGGSTQMYSISYRGLLSFEGPSRAEPGEEVKISYNKVTGTPMTLNVTCSDGSHIPCDTSSVNCSVTFIMPKSDVKVTLESTGPQLVDQWVQIDSWDEFIERVQSINGGIDNVVILTNEETGAKFMLRDSAFAISDVQDLTIDDAESCFPFAYCSSLPSYDIYFTACNNVVSGYGCAVWISEKSSGDQYILFSDGSSDFDYTAEYYVHSTS